MVATVNTDYAGSKLPPAQEMRYVAGGKRYTKKRSNFQIIRPDSSMVEHAAVNRRVVGSSPTQGAKSR